MIQYTDTTQPLQPIRLAAVCLLALQLGCGAGDYNKRVVKSLEHLEKTSQFSRYLHDNPTRISDGVDFNVPRLFGSESESFRNGDEVEPLRLNPFGNSKMPGLLFCHEQRFGPPGGKMPVYVYVAMETEENMPLQQFLDAIKGGMQASIQGSSPTWETKNIINPQASTLQVQYASATGTQQFDLGRQLGGVRALAARTDFYVYSKDGKHVALGWRSPTEVAEESGLFDTSELSVGSIVIQ